jgi:hypothetical protein
VDNGDGQKQVDVPQKQGNAPKRRLRGHGQKLTRLQSVLIVNLLTCPTYAKAASKTGINEATVYRWLGLPAFQAAYRAARRKIIDAAVFKLAKLAGKAVDALERNLRCGDAGQEIRAALGVLEHVRGLASDELEERLGRLEERAGALPAAGVNGFHNGSIRR